MLKIIAVFIICIFYIAIMAASQYLTAYCLPLIFDALMENEGVIGSFAHFLVGDEAVMLIISGAITLLMIAVAAHVRRKKFSTFISMGDEINGKIARACVLIGIGGNFWISTIVTTVFSKKQIEAYDAASGALDVSSSFVMLLAVAVLGPILEEIIFRGIILSRLSDVMKTEIAVVVQAVFFGIMHGNLIWISYAVFMGIILGYIKVCTNSLEASTIAHMSYNIGSPIAAVVLYLFTAASNPYIMLMITGAAMMVYGLITVNKCRS